MTEKPLYIAEEDFGWVEMPPGEKSIVEQMREVFAEKEKPPYLDPALLREQETWSFLAKKIVGG